MNEKTESANVLRYLALLEHIQAKVGDEQVAIAIMHEIAKDRRMAQIVAERGSRDKAAANGDEQPASEKQLGYLRDLTGDVPAGLTRQQASAMIDQALANQAA